MEPPSSSDTHTRKARMSDIPAILALINGYAAQAIMLPRTEFELSEFIRDFTVVYKGSELIGCAALHFYGPSIAELRSLAVAPASKGTGAGRLLMEAIDEEARAFDLHSLFAFTYVPEFFAKMGYELVDRNELPLKAWKDCLRCPKFQACDEIAVLKRLKSTPMPSFRPEATQLVTLQQITLPRPSGH
ncbi:N-acetyltransferase [Bryobacter aggregatus]|uniref:N-acetyltransferase n=1 Tax=Bryobacter aggregatus TaxID=360054 RepID=UPI00068C1382|nr:N-acetyltransferase [Bryobacter aggregatus]